MKEEAVTSLFPTTRERLVTDPETSCWSTLHGTSLRFRLKSLPITWCLSLEDLSAGNWMTLGWGQRWRHTSGFNCCRIYLGGRRLGSNEWSDSGRKRTQTLALDALLSYVEQPAQTGQAQIWWLPILFTDRNTQRCPWDATAAITEHFLGALSTI